jgi:hypothetical protein
MPVRKLGKAEYSPLFADVKDDRQLLANANTITDTEPSLGVVLSRANT